MLQDCGDARLEAAAALLAEQGFIVSKSDSIEDVFPEVSVFTPEIVLLHWALGFDVIARLRAERPLAIIVVCGAPGDDAGTEALGAGADDYIDGRCAARTVLARVQAHRRRSSRPPPGPAPVHPVAASGRCCVLPGGVASIDGVRIELTRIEERLFIELIRRLPGEATKADMLSAGWPDAARTSEHTFHVRLSGLRAKLVPLGADVVLVHGCGYRLAFSFNRQ